MPNAENDPRRSLGAKVTSNTGEIAVGLDRFIELLLRWNRRINLVASLDANSHTLRARHIADSLQILPLLPDDDGPVGDIGSGAGFPGLVVAIATRREVHLIEADRRKAAFLADAASQLGLTNVVVHPVRLERVTLSGLSAVTARAFAPLTEILPHAARLLKPDGAAILLKGRTAEAELKSALTDWGMTVERFASKTEPAATIMRLSGIHRAIRHA